MMRALEEVFVGAPIVGFCFLLRAFACRAWSIGFEGHGYPDGGDVERDGDVFDHGFERGGDPGQFGANQQRVSGDGGNCARGEYLFGVGGANESGVGDVQCGDIVGKDGGANGVATASGCRGKF